MCTTVPPAKSRTPLAASHPEGSHTQCAMGEYTTSDQTAMKMSMEENFMRSANEPHINAGVMIAKVSWNMAYTVSGTVSPRCETVSFMASCW